MDNRKRLEVAISRIVNECPESAVARLIQVVGNQSITKFMSVYECSKLMIDEQIPSALMSDFVDAWVLTDLSYDSLIFGIQTASKTRRQIVGQQPTIDLVWTGPYAPSSGNVRTTLAVMQEMIASAKWKILLVGYSITMTSASPKAVIDQLIQAKRRGCEVRVALHDDGYNYWNLKQIWPKSMPLPVLLKWSGKPGDNMASLHAKLLLIDDNELLVTSANLTHHGLFSNIEVGVRVKGEIAKQMGQHFYSLERSGILKRIEGGNQ